MTVAPTIEAFEQFEAATEKLLIPPFRSSFGAIEWKNRKRPRRRLQYLVEDWLTTAGVSVIGGRSSCGKSFLALHLSLCIARGVDFFGLTVRRCGVVYQAGEGGLGLLDRMEAYAQHFKVPEDEDIAFAMLPGKIDIFTKEKKDVDLFIEEVNVFSKAWEEKFGFPAGLVVIDTLKKAAPGIDEISGKDNAVVLDNVSRIERETRCHVCLVHHTNADGKKLRGHTSLRDDVDQVILIEHDKETGIRDAVLDKIKDGEDGRKIRFSLISVPVRTETMGDGTTKEFTSCAIVTVSEGATEEGTGEAGLLGQPDRAPHPDELLRDPGPAREVHRQRQGRSEGRRRQGRRRLPGLCHGRARKDGRGRGQDQGPRADSEGVHPREGRPDQVRCPEDGEPIFVVGWQGGARLCADLPKIAKTGRNRDKHRTNCGQPHFARHG
ncbi:AAA family ATPase [Mesorhizobium atlanticum]